jgi:hypothetical protein
VNGCVNVHGIEILKYSLLVDLYGLYLNDGSLNVSERKIDVVLVVNIVGDVRGYGSCCDEKTVSESESVAY